MINYGQLREQLLDGSQNCLDFTKSILKKIDENKDLNAFITVCHEYALEQANESNQRFENGKPRKLEGMIVAIKDNISTKGIRTTNASLMLENYTPVFDATVIDRLRNEGAIIIGKTNLDEFAMGSSNETSYFGPVLNQFNKEYVPGGSSGGSAVAVGAGLCHVALGSDTGGSIRQPAAFTDTVGFKPSYGTISRYGLLAFASSLDQIGVFASNIDDCALVTDVMSGIDDKDSTTLQKPSLNSFTNINQELERKFTFGILAYSIIERCSPAVTENYYSSLEKLKSAGITLKQVDFSNTQAWIPVYYILSTAEASSNLSRYDGIRFGYRADAEDEENMVVKTRTLGFGSEVKKRIMLGTYVLSSGYYDAFYVKAQKARRLISNNYNSIFSEVDFLFMPTTPTPPFKLNEKINDPIAMYLSDFFTASANLAGIPAISIPSGYSQMTGLPIGMQLQASFQNDEKLLAVSKYVMEILKG